MDKKKVIIWGIGSGYYKREAILKEKCEIIAYTGNQKATKEIGLPFIEPNQLAEKEYDEVVICSIPYFYTIKYQLQNYYHIPSYKIGCITDWIIKRDLIDEEVEQKIFQSVETYIEKNHNPSFEVKKENMWLICDDLADNAGAINKLYLMQDIWAAKEVYQSGVKEHYDIGSRLDGFLTHLLVFCDRVNYIDIRPLDSKIEGLHFVQADATNLDGIANESISSLSSLHAIEHFGLGRYGDPVDPDACFKAMEALQRVLKKSGRLYFSVPVGSKDELVFNAHRIFHPMTIIKSFSNLKLIEFSYLKENEVVHVPEEKINEEISHIKQNSTGLFAFIKE